MPKKQLFTLVLILFLLTSCSRPNQKALDVVASINSDTTTYLYVIADIDTFDNSYNQCANNIIDHYLKNDFPSVKFSYDNGYPNQITAYVYGSMENFKSAKQLFTIDYSPKSSANSDRYNVKENYSEYTFNISYATKKGL